MGLGYKVFANGNLLGASDIMGYLMKQAVMVFSNTTTRSAAGISDEGMLSYLASVQGFEFYTGGEWTPLGQKVIRKGSAETVTNSVALQNDEDLKIALKPGHHRIEAFLSVSGPAAANVKTDWTFSGTSSYSTRACVGPGLTSTNPMDGTVKVTPSALSSVQAYGTDGTNYSLIREDIYIIVTTAGTLQLRWAQNTANASATSMLDSSRIIPQRVRT